MREPSLVLDGVTKRFDRTVAVDAVSLAVRGGSITGLIGRNGAGKTTTLRMLAGVLRPDEGSIRYFGAPWTPAVRDRVAYLPEERGLYRKMTVRDHLLFLAAIKGRTGAEARRGTEAALERLGLLAERGRRIEELSKGNQQKVQLAGALVGEPDVLLLDEPMSGLDPVHVVLVREVLHELRGRGRSVLLSTHLMGEAEKLCDEVCLVHRGRVVLAGPLADVRAADAANAVHVEFEGGPFPAGLPGVARAEVGGRHAELRLAEGADTNALLARLAAGVRVLRFEVTRPSLEDVFVRRVGTDAPEEGG